MPSKRGILKSTMPLCGWGTGPPVTFS